MQHTDFKSMPSQVLCLAAAIKFTQQAEQAIEAGKLSSLQVWCSYINHCCIHMLDMGFSLDYCTQCTTGVLLLHNTEHISGIMQVYSGTTFSSRTPFYLIKAIKEVCGSVQKVAQSVVYNS